MIKATLVFFILLLITGCSTETNSNNHTTAVKTSSNSSYVAKIFVSGEVLNTGFEIANELGLEVGELIGTVKEKTDVEKRPTVELTSNFLDYGTEIYSVEGNPDIVLAKQDNGDYLVFK
ncbi:MULTISPECIES: hypothetical protein [Ureibacillus]|uniref:DUF3221 domain-containing protein n=2 Tax=Ureibacillus TaxID=160795 RepID=A0A0A3IXG9_9BACL|nr:MULTISPECIES: hypothetical protein [Ureibacillus]KGR89391.1 hypothetical protein CD30_17165 [Ureibacillus massiliensis 4400831 = CIP 108448 = CCUG 49529]MCM3390397.1 hypothetical protein [Ureibacillus chungkukjangi]PYF08568.1 hypothetical protein BJ095_102335 [Ureibacillus chungkukjangi]